MNVTYKQISIAGVAVLVLLAGSFVSGRYSAPLHEITKTVIAEDLVAKKRETLHIVYDVKEIVKVVHDIKVATNVKTHSKTTEMPNGTKITEVDTEDLTKSDDNTDSSSDLESHTEAVATKDEDTHLHLEQSKTVEIFRAKPQWSLQLQLGYDFAGALGHETYSLLSDLPVKHTVLGISLDRRLIGPVFVGVWFNSALMGGLTGRAEF